MNQDITPPTSNQSFGTSQSTDTPSSIQPPSDQGKVIPLQSGPKKGKLKAFFLVLLFLLLLAGVAGAYYYQQGKIDDATTAKATVDKKLSTLQAQLSTTQAKAVADAKKSVTPSAASYDVVTGDVTTQAVGTATINTLYKPTIKEIWIEYGTAPDALSTASKHVTDGLGAGAADTYNQQSFAVTGLKNGQNYFYRVAAKSATGTTIYGGITSFTSTK